MVETYKEQILVVDDEEINLSLLVSALKFSGFRCMTAKSGTEAIQICKDAKRRPALILMDYSMPGITGAEAIQAIHGLSDCQSIPVIAVSAHVAGEPRRLMLQSGAVDFLERPFEIEELMLKIKNHLSLQRLSQRVEAQARQLQGQLNRAREIQMGLLPPHPLSLPGCVIDYIYSPSINVGGDYLDIIPLSERRVAVVIGDVSGHGLGAAMTAAMVKSLVKAYIYFYSPSELLYELNDQLLDLLPPPDYVTLCYIEIDTELGKITVANAGHPPLVKFNRKNRTVEVLDRGRHNPILGMFEKASFQEEVFDIEDGDSLLLYTDGLIELLSGKPGSQNPETITQFVQEQKFPSDNQLLGRMSECLHRQVETQNIQDDLACISIGFRGAGLPAKKAAQPTILLVEDNDFTRETLAAAISGEGYQCLVANDGQDAVDLLEKSKVDLIISDISMPRMDGLTFLEKVHEKSPLTRVLIISAMATEPNIMRAFERNAASFLPKPFSRKKLIEQIQQILEENIPPWIAEKVPVQPGGGFEYEMSFPSHFLAPRRFDRFFRLLASLIVPEEHIPMLSTCIQELMRNAIEYGAPAEDARISVEMKLSSTEAQMRVSDPGPGFDWKTILALHLDPVQLQKQRVAKGQRPGGLGLSIIRAYMDKLEFNEPGNVVMVKKTFIKKPSAEEKPHE